ncbi:glycoside hydrolase family 17 protein [Fomitiporia mediterranea MF3/22]|uniref:glycoside hydrolase family 17 protein n=1 Tax=Fomitiporia mediterranea (strain MF3/22) TaxID=694068 RepID=UPI00044072DD|nr:glycoside hydrolase family 17 protein [Fomitiporia mediterranea MF3/22]EJD06882.1 glycoside hydrolase family 17 protein [Fomitiporia mediterranea MF3/22]
MEPNSAWLEKGTRSSSSRTKWIVIGSIVGIAAIIAVAVGVGVGVAKSKSHDNKNLDASNPSGQSSSGDPSQFTKNSALKQSFYGIAYTPEGSQLPNCGNNLEQVITDIQLLSQLTTRLRLYGADCNQSALVLEAVKQTKVNMTVYLGNYNVPTDGGAAYVRQRDVIKDAIQTYGTDHIGGITVGNEFMLNWLNSQSATADAVNTAVGNAGAELLIQNITDTRNMLSSMGVSLPVGNSDAGSFFNNEILAAVDYGMANVHPWFANTSIDNAAGWTAEFFQDTNIAQANQVSNKPHMYIAETGWPTKSSDAGNANNGASDASIPNLQKFLDTFVCQANTNGTGYFFFEYFDEVWKDQQFGGVEGWWGLFNSDRTLKDITIPDCSQQSS